MTRTTSGVSRRQARRRLDERTDVLRQALPELGTPRGGWLRAVREALGMSSMDLAARLGVNESTVLRLEASERADTAQLSSLRRAAAALDCDLVYALVPRRSLETMVLTQARLRAADFVTPVRHTMLLEDQSPSQSSVDGLLADAAAEWADKPGLWNA